MKFLPALVLLGETASGKTALVNRLFSSSPVEVIGVDSKEIYKEALIGTSSPTEEEKRKFPHHLYNFLDIFSSFSAGDFLKKVKALLPEIYQRRKVPLFVVGTPFYLKVLWDGIVEEKKEDSSLKKEIHRLSLEKKLAILKERDYESYLRIDKKNPRRVERALYLVLLYNMPIREIPREEGLYNKYPFYSFWLYREKEELKKRIEERVKKMFKKGLLEEIFFLYKKDPTFSSPIWEGIGYKEFLPYLKKKGDFSSQDLQEIEKAIIKNTVLFAKRQRTWFRRFLREKRIKKVDPLSCFLEITSVLKKI